MACEGWEGEELDEHACDAVDGEEEADSLGLLQEFKDSC